MKSKGLFDRETSFETCLDARLKKGERAFDRIYRMNRISGKQNTFSAAPDERLKGFPARGG
jgi:hypothetical protein